MAELIQFPFVRGMDEGADPKGLPAGAVLSLENRYIDKMGRVVKRPGVTALAASILGGGSISAGVCFVSRGTDKAIFDGTHVYVYSDALDVWKAADRPPPLKSTRRPLLDVTRSVSRYDQAIYGDLLVMFYQTGTSASTALYVEVRNLSDGTVVKPATYVAAGSYPRVVMNTAGTIAYLLFSNASNELHIWTLTMSSLAAASGGTIVTDIAGTFDAVLAAVSGTDTIFVAYELTAGASRGRLASVELTGYTVVDTATFAGTGYNHFAIDSNGSVVHCVYGETVSNDTRVISADSSLTVSAGPTTLDSSGNTGWGCSVAVYDATQILVAWSRDNGSGTAAPRLTTALLDNTHSTVFATSRVTYGLVWPSRFFTLGSRWYLGATVSLFEYNVSPTKAAPNASGVVIEVEIADSLTGANGGTHPQVATLENYTGVETINRLTPLVSGSTAYVPAAYRTREPTVSKEGVSYGIGLHTLTALTGLSPCAVGLGGALVPAAAPFWWDGTTAMPYGFAHAPMVQPPAASAGGSQAAGVYGYIGTYLWRDTNGIGHRSAPSPSTSGTTTGANLTLSPITSSCSLSSKQRALFGTAAVNPVVVELWRTEKDAATYYQLIDGIANTNINDPQATDVTFTDGDADSTLAGREQVYTATGALDSLPPPASIAALTQSDRFWVLAADGHTVWASQSFVEDPTMAPGFNEALTTYFAGAKTALGRLPNAVAVLGEDTIDLIAGSGPDASGNGAWSSQPVQTDLGCTEPRSLATIPQGLVYKSRRGIELLTTGLTIEWIGEAIQDQLVTYPNVTSAVVVSDKRQVRISVENDAASAGRVLVYDYGRNAWSVWNYGFPIADAAIIGNIYTLLRYNGVVYQENATHRDGTTYVESAATVVLTTSGPNSWKQLKHAQVESTNVTPYTLTMSIKRDFADDYEYEKVFPSASDATDVGPHGRARITPPVQKGQGFVLRIEDSAADSDDTSDSGEGPIWESLAVWVQRKPGLPRISASRRG